MHATRNSVPRLPAPTKRLGFRPLTSVDVPGLFAIFGDPEVCRYWSRPPLENPEAAERLLDEIEAGWAASRLFQFGLVSREAGVLLGTFTLYGLEPRHRRAEIGFALARERWGSGLMGEALDALLPWAFAGFDLHRLEADVHPDNAASLRCLERRGFRREGLLRERYWLSGEWQGAVLLGLLRHEYGEGA